MFGRFKISLGRVRDEIEVIEGDESLKLHVNSDPQRMVAGLSLVQTRLQAVTEETTPEEIHETALKFAEVIFGKEQALALSDFYHGDAGCMISICSKYFADRLRGKITKAQKKHKIK